MTQPGQHKLPPLPYDYNALEPVISSMTLHLHHDIYHKTYVDDLNQAEIKLVDARIANCSQQVEGSGWAILTWQPTLGCLEIKQVEKHQNLTQWIGIPILVLDIWEHAYNFDYQNKRNDYIKDWWQIVNWNEVERRLKLAMKGEVTLIMT
jgi:superoxide dismutase